VRSRFDTAVVDIKASIAASALDRALAQLREELALPNLMENQREALQGLLEAVQQEMAKGAAQDAGKAGRRTGKAKVPILGAHLSLAGALADPPCGGKPQLRGLATGAMLWQSGHAAMASAHMAVQGMKAYGRTDNRF
jgi:hypothetical protein